MWSRLTDDAHKSAVKRTRASAHVALGAYRSLLGAWHRSRSPLQGRSRLVRSCQMGSETRDGHGDPSEPPLRRTRQLAERRYVAPVCFSPEGDLAGGLVVTAIGVDACRHLRGRRTYVLLATVPLLLGAHQLDEAFVWWGLEGDVPRSVGRIAMWIYLVIALVVLPLLVPLAILRLEPTARRRWSMVPFVALGAVVAIVLLVTMLRGPVTVELGAYHLSYSIGLRDGLVVVGLYVVATCGSLLLSGYKDIVIFGVANLVAVVVLAALAADGFASLWCFYAALASGAISLHMRLARPHRADPYALT